MNRMAKLGRLAVVAALTLGAIGSTALWAADLPINDGQKIAFMGDSITQGGVGPNGYVTLVIKGLDANGVKAAMIPAGVGGHKSNNMLAAIAKGGAEKKGNLLTRDGVHMNPDGNRMMATGVLKAFGLSEEQIALAQKSWAEDPAAVKK